MNVPLVVLIGSPKEPLERMKPTSPVAVPAPPVTPTVTGTAVPCVIPDALRLMVVDELLKVTLPHCFARL